MDGGSLGSLLPTVDPAGNFEPRQVWARDVRRPGIELVFLRVGAAEDLRDACHRGRLICPLPDCPDPAFTSRAGVYRDHFVHTGHAAKHAAETVAHFTAKHMIGQWLRKRHPDASVTVDDSTVETGQRPDVLAIFPDGSRLAFEVQYSGLGYNAWVARHEGYVASGIRDVWLWGHLRRWLRPPRSQPADDRHVESKEIERPPLDRVALHRDILSQIDDLAGPVFWVDPERREIVTRRRYSDRPDNWSGGGAYRLVDVRRDDLALCRIEAGALWTPTRHRDDVIQEERRRAEEAERERTRLAQEAERERRERAATEERAKRAKARDARKAAHDGRMANSRAWARYKQSIVDVGRPLPPIVEDRLEADVYVGLHPAHWHALMFAKFLNRRIRERSDLNEIVAFVAERSGDEPRFIEGSVRTYLFHLERFGFLRSERDDGRTWIVVLADADRPPAGPASDSLWQARQQREERTEREWIDEGGDLGEWRGSDLDERSTLNVGR